MGSKKHGNVDQILEMWDNFIEDRSLPYHRADHSLMMRQILNRFPPKKLNDLSDRDLLETINLDDTDEKLALKRSSRYFLVHFDQFLEKMGLE